MYKFPLNFQNDHLFLEIEENLWLLDTGAPTSFGNIANLTFAGKQFSISKNYMGLTAETLSKYIGVGCFGILGADVLVNFDFIFDTISNTLTISSHELSHPGQKIALDEFMGIPVVTVRISGSNYRMFLDSGAQISYFQDDSLANFPFAGRVPDFYPGVGQFETEIHEVPVSLGDSLFTLQCGTLPGLLGMTLMLADVQGIVGNAILQNRTIGYFPRRGLLSI